MQQEYSKKQQQKQWEENYEMTITDDEKWNTEW